MPRLFVGNFHFEHELTAVAGWHPSVALKRISAERVPSWISLAEDGDLIWTPEPVAEDFWHSLARQGLPRVRGVVDLSSAARNVDEVVPWGWSARTRAISGAIAQPSDSSVRQGNSREWSFAMEHELRVAPFGAARLERMEDLAEAVRRSASEFGEPVVDHAWVIKANFGMAARERLLGRGLAFAPAQRTWLSRRLDSDGAVYFEPWLQRCAEVGIQWTLPPPGQGRPKLEGVTPLLCDPQGGYRGSEFSLDTSVPNEWQRAVEVCEQVAKRLQSLGYFGPLGIDAAIYEDATGTAHARPLQDINARFTMGRLALGFRRLLRSGECGVWRHERTAERTPLATDEAAREIDLTPPLVGGTTPANGSRLCIRRADFADRR